MSSDADPDHARQTHFDLVMDKVVDKVLVEKEDKRVDKVRERGQGDEQMSSAGHPGQTTCVIHALIC